MKMTVIDHRIESVALQHRTHNMGGEVSHLYRGGDGTRADSESAHASPSDASPWLATCRAPMWHTRNRSAVDDAGQLGDMLRQLHEVTEDNGFVELVELGAPYQIDPLPLCDNDVAVDHRGHEKEDIRDVVG